MCGHTERYAMFATPRGHTENYVWSAVILWLATYRIISTSILKGKKIKVAREVLELIILPSNANRCTVFMSVNLTAIPLIPYSYGVEVFIFLWIYTQSVGLFGRVISLSQGLYLYTNTEKHTHTLTKHPYPTWVSNPRSQRQSDRRDFMPETARLPWPPSLSE
jgi:hypothetical protein